MHKLSSAPVLAGHSDRAELGWRTQSRLGQNIACQIVSPVVMFDCQFYKPDNQSCRKLVLCLTFIFFNLQITKWLTMPVFPIMQFT